MACVWCEGDTELHEQLFKVLSGEKEENYDDLRRAIIDFYSCLDCINAYHRSKLIHVKNENQFQAIWRIEESRICDMISKATKDIKTEEDVDINLPLFEVLQNTYYFGSEHLTTLLCQFVETLYDNMQKIPWDFCLEYPGLFLLLVSRSRKVREWSFQTLKDFPQVSSESNHKYLRTVNSLFHLISYQQVERSEESVNPLYPGILPEKLPTFMYSRDSNILFVAYKEILKLLPSRLLRTALSSNKNKDFFLCLVHNMKESEDLFWDGVSLLTSFLQQLDSSFWLISNAFSAPNQLYFSLKSNNHYLKAVEKAKRTPFTENSNNETDEFFQQFASQNHYQSFQEVFIDVTKSSVSPMLFSWMLPLLKTLSEFNNHFGEMVSTITLCLFQVIEENQASSDISVCATSCIMCIIEFLIDITQLDLLNHLSVQVVKNLVAISKWDLASVPDASNTYSKLKTSTQNVISRIVAKSVGIKHISENENLHFRSNWMKMIKMGKDFDINVINGTLYKLFRKIAVKMEETDDKRAIQEQIRLQERLDSNEVILIDSDDDEGDIIRDKNGVIKISDSESDECLDIGGVDEPIDDTHLQDVKGRFPLLFSGSQSPIRISDDDDNDVEERNLDYVEAIEKVETERKAVSSGVSSDETAKYNEDWHGEFHFSIASQQDGTTTPSTDATTPDTLSPDAVSKKPAFNLSSIKEKLGGALDKKKLIRNQQMTKKRTIEEDGDADVPQQAAGAQQSTNSIYENQLFDITSNFHHETESEKIKAPPDKRKRSTVKIALAAESRRERLEKEMFSSAAPGPSHTKIKSKPATVLPPPSLPVLTSKRRYTMDMFNNSILMWDPVWLEEGRDELDISAKLNSVPLTYNSFDEYVKVNWPLMMLETWAQLRRDWDECKDTAVRKAFQIESFVEKANVKISYLRCSYLESATKDSPRHTNDIFAQDLVFLSFNNGQMQLFGIVDSIERGFYKNRKLKVYTLNIVTRNSASNNNFKSVIITRITSLVTVLRQWNGLINFQNSLLCGDVLKPFRSQTYDMKDRLLIRTDRLMKLNHDQFQAVSAATRAVLGPYTIPRVCLIQGPPGTGKSYTVKTIITHLMQEFRKARMSKVQEQPSTKLSQKKKGDRDRILICAPSNAAVNEIVKRLLSSPPRIHPQQTEANKKNNCGDFNLIRIGRQAESALRHCTLEYLVDQKMQSIRFNHNPDAIRRQIKKLTHVLEDLDKTCVKLKMSANPREKIEEYHKKMKEREVNQQSYDDLTKRLNVATAEVNLQQERKRYIQNLLLHADIICCTLSGAGSDCMLKTFQKENAFKCVLVDEAGQCSEPDLLVPLQFGTSKLILVGDQNQLPATVLSQKAIRYNYGQSLFERIVHALHQHRTQYNDNSKGDRAAFMLTTQYRMTKEICSFPSKRFYENRLRPAKQLVAEKSWPLRPYMVINIKNGNEKKSASGSLHNPVEREYVLELCKAILSRTSIKMQEIGIVTPYRQQVSMLKDVFKKNKLEGVVVNTIDGYQGQERNIIILSCVRGPNQKNTVGFLSHPQRMNVALTRAKKTLVVLSNQAVQVDDDWKELFTDASDRNLLFNTDTAQDAVKHLLRERNVAASGRPNLPTAPTTSQHRREQPRGVLLLEEAPMPPRPTDPRRSQSKVGEDSYLCPTYSVVEAQPQDAPIQPDDCFLPPPSINEDGRQGTPSSQSTATANNQLASIQPEEQISTSNIDVVDSLCIENHTLDKQISIKSVGVAVVDPVFLQNCILKAQTNTNNVVIVDPACLQNYVQNEQISTDNDTGVVNQAFSENGTFDEQVATANTCVDDQQTGNADVLDSTSMECFMHDTSTNNDDDVFEDDDDDSHQNLAELNSNLVEKNIITVANGTNCSSSGLVEQDCKGPDTHSESADNELSLGSNTNLTETNGRKELNVEAGYGGVGEDLQAKTSNCEPSISNNVWIDDCGHATKTGIVQIDSDVCSLHTLAEKREPIVTGMPIVDETSQVQLDTLSTVNTNNCEPLSTDLLFDDGINNRDLDACSTATDDTLDTTSMYENYVYLSEKEDIIGTGDIKFVSDACVLNVAVESKLCKWRTKCYELRHNYNRNSGSCTEDEDLSSEEMEDSAADSDNDQRHEYSMEYEDISDVQSEPGEGKENNCHTVVLSSQPVVRVNKIDVNNTSKYYFDLKNLKNEMHSPVKYSSRKDKKHKKEPLSPSVGFVKDNTLKQEPHSPSKYDSLKDPKRKTSSSSVGFMRDPKVKIEPLSPFKYGCVKDDKPKPLRPCKHEFMKDVPSHVKYGFVKDNNFKKELLSPIKKYGLKNDLTQNSKHSPVSAQGSEMEQRDTLVVENNKKDIAMKVKDVSLFDSSGVFQLRKTKTIASQKRRSKSTNDRTVRRTDTERKTTDSMTSRAVVTSKASQLHNRHETLPSQKYRSRSDSSPRVGKLADSESDRKREGKIEKKQNTEIFKKDSQEVFQLHSRHETLPSQKYRSRSDSRPRFDKIDDRTKTVADSETERRRVRKIEKKQNTEIFKKDSQEVFQLHNRYETLPSQKYRSRSDSGPRFDKIGDRIKTVADSETERRRVKIENEQNTEIFKKDSQAVSQLNSSDTLPSQKYRSRSHSSPRFDKIDDRTKTVADSETERRRVRKIENEQNTDIFKKDSQAVSQSVSQLNSSETLPSQKYRSRSDSSPRFDKIDDRTKTVADSETERRRVRKIENEQNTDIFKKDSQAVSQSVSQLNSSETLPSQKYRSRSDSSPRFDKIDDRTKTVADSETERRRVRKIENEQNTDIFKKDSQAVSQSVSQLNSSETLPSQKYRSRSDSSPRFDKIDDRTKTMADSESDRRMVRKIENEQNTGQDSKKVSQLNSSEKIPRQKFRSWSDSDPRYSKTDERNMYANQTVSVNNPEKTCDEKRVSKIETEPVTDSKIYFHNNHETSPRQKYRSSSISDLRVSKTDERVIYLKRTRLIEPNKMTEARNTEEKCDALSKILTSKASKMIGAIRQNDDIIDFSLDNQKDVAVPVKDSTEKEKIAKIEFCIDSERPCISESDITPRDLICTADKSDTCSTQSISDPRTNEIKTNFVNDSVVSTDDEIKTNIVNYSVLSTDDEIKTNIVNDSVVFTDEYSTASNLKSGIDPKMIQVNTNSVSELRVSEINSNIVKESTSHADVNSVSDPRTKKIKISKDSEVPTEDNSLDVESNSDPRMNKIMTNITKESVVTTDLNPVNLILKTIDVGDSIQTNIVINESLCSTEKDFLDLNLESLSDLRTNKIEANVTEGSVALPDQINTDAVKEPMLRVDNGSIDLKSESQGYVTTEDQIIKDDVSSEKVHHQPCEQDEIKTIDIKPVGAKSSITTDANTMLSPTTLKKKLSFASYMEVKRRRLSIDSADGVHNSNGTGAKKNADVGESSDSDFTSFVDAELEKKVDEQFAVEKGKSTGFLKDKKEDFELGVSIKLLSKEVNTTQNRQRQLVLLETIRKLKRLQSQDADQQILCPSQKVKSSQESQTSDSTELVSVPEPKSDFSQGIWAFEEANVIPQLEPTMGQRVVVPISPAKSNASVDSETSHVKGKVKQSYMRLPHRHEDGVKCVTHCCRFPITEKSMEADRPTTSSQDIALLGRVRDAPSRAYFNFPHRHSDGTYCELVCSRVLSREQSRAALGDISKQPPPPPPPPTRDIPWKLIPIDFAKKTVEKLADPRLRSLYPTAPVNSLDPRTQQQKLDSFTYQRSQSLDYQSNFDDHIAQPEEPYSSHIAYQRSQSLEYPSNVDDRFNPYQNAASSNYVYGPNPYINYSSQATVSDHTMTSSISQTPRSGSDYFQYPTYNTSNGPVTDISNTESSMLSTQQVDASYHFGQYPSYQQYSNTSSKEENREHMGTDFPTTPVGSFPDERTDGSYHPTANAVTETESCQPTEDASECISTCEIAMDVCTPSDVELEAGVESESSSEQSTEPSQSVVKTGNCTVNNFANAFLPTVLLKKCNMSLNSTDNSGTNNGNPTDSKSKPDECSGDDVLEADKLSNGRKRLDTTPEKDSYLAQRNLEFVQDQLQGSSVDQTLESVECVKKSLITKTLNTRIGVDQTENPSISIGVTSDDIFPDAAKEDDCCNEDDDIQPLTRDDTSAPNPTCQPSDPRRMRKRFQNSIFGSLDFDNNSNSSFENREDDDVPCQPVRSPSPAPIHHTILTSPKAVSASANDYLKDAFQREIHKTYIRSIINQQQNLKQAFLAQTTSNPSNRLTGKMNPLKQLSMTDDQQQQPHLQTLYTPSNAYSQPTRSLLRQTETLISPNQLQSDSSALSFFRSTSIPETANIAPQPPPRLLSLPPTPPSRDCYQNFFGTSCVEPYTSNGLPSLSGNRNLDALELLTPVISQSLDAHLTRYFNERPTDDDRLYLLNFIKGFAAALLDKTPVNNKGMLLELINTATRNALDTVIKMKDVEQPSMKHAGLEREQVNELMPLQLNRNPPENPLAVVDNHALYLQSCEEKERFDTRSLDSFGETKDGQRSDKWKPVDAIAPVMKAKLPVQKKPSTKRRNSSRYSSDSDLDTSFDSDYNDEMHTRSGVDDERSTKIDLNNNQEMYTRPDQVLERSKTIYSDHIEDNHSRLGRDDERSKTIYSDHIDDNHSRLGRDDERSETIYSDHIDDNHPRLGRDDERSETIDSDHIDDMYARTDRENIRSKAIDLNYIDDMNTISDRDCKRSKRNGSDHDDCMYTRLDYIGNMYTRPEKEDRGDDICTIPDGDIERSKTVESNQIGKMYMKPTRGNARSKRKVYLSKPNDPRVAPRGKSTGIGMSKQESAGRPANLGSFKLSLGDIEQLNRMNLDEEPAPKDFSNTGSIRKKRRISARDDRKVCYDITDERLREIRRCTSNNSSTKSRKSEVVAVPKKKVSPDLREKIESLKNKRKSKKKLSHWL